MSPLDPLETQHEGLDPAFRRHAFGWLRRTGRGVQVSSLLESSPVSVEVSRTPLDMLVDRGMAMVEREHLVAIDELSIRETAHEMTLGGRRLFTWCAADAVGIPAALSEDATVVTSCPHCSWRIEVEVVRGPAARPRMSGCGCRWRCAPTSSRSSVRT